MRNCEAELAEGENAESSTVDTYAQCLPGDVLIRVMAELEARTHQFDRANCYKEAAAREADESHQPTAITNLDRQNENIYSTIAFAEGHKRGESTETSLVIYLILFWLNVYVVTFIETRDALSAAFQLCMCILHRVVLGVCRVAAIDGVEANLLMLFNCHL